MTSPKYPGWTIEKVSGKRYFMTRDAGIYAISVERFGDEWFAELLTKQTDPDTRTLGWEPVRRNPCQGRPADVVKVAEHRARWIERHEAAKRNDVKSIAKHFFHI